MPKTDHITAARLRDYRIQDQASRTLGFVADVVFEPVAGRLTHAIVRCEGGALGAAKHVLVPWDELTVAYNEQVLLLTGTNKTLDDYGEAPFDLLHRGLEAGAPEGSGASGSFML